MGENEESASLVRKMLGAMRASGEFPMDAGEISSGSEAVVSDVLSDLLGTVETYLGNGLADSILDVAQVLEGIIEQVEADLAPVDFAPIEVMEIPMLLKVETALEEEGSDTSAGEVLSPVREEELLDNSEEAEVNNEVGDLTQDVQALQATIEELTKLNAAELSADAETKDPEPIVVSIKEPVDENQRSVSTNLPKEACEGGTQPKVKEEVEACLQGIVDQLALPEEAKIEGQKICADLVLDIVSHVCELKQKAERFKAMFEYIEEPAAEHEDVSEFQYQRMPETYSRSYVDKPERNNKLATFVLADHSISEIPLCWTENVQAAAEEEEEAKRKAREAEEAASAAASPREPTRRKRGRASTVKSWFTWIWT